MADRNRGGKPIEWRARVLQLNESDTRKQSHEDVRVGATLFLGTIVYF
jgi:hypothetical protein